MTRIPLALSVAAAATLSLTACSSGGSSPTATMMPSETAVAAAPVTVDNCGFALTVDTPPAHIVTIKSTTTELLIALGLGDSIVGAAFLDGPIETPYSAFTGEVPVLSDFLPGQEATLALEPDLIFGGWESNFSADGVGERDALAAQGIASYVAPSACKEEGYQPDPMTFEALYAQIEEAGTVFGAQEAAASVVDAMRADLAAVTPLDGGLTALWYSSGTDSPYVGAGIGAPQMMMNAAGLTNIFAGVDDTWTSVTWEAIIDADPDVIVLVDASWNTAASKIEALEANPATATLTAVREGSYAVVPFAAGEAGVRNAIAVQSIVDQLSAQEAA